MKLVLGALLAMSLFATNHASAACDIDFAIINNDADKVHINRVQIMTKGGPWRNLPIPGHARDLMETYGQNQYQSFDLNPGERKGTIDFVSPFSCDVKRRVRVDLICADATFLTRYYPNETDWFEFTSKVKLNSGTTVRTKRHKVEIGVGGRCESSRTPGDGQIIGLERQAEPARRTDND